MNIFEKPLFEMKFINVEYIFYHIYLFLRRIFGNRIDRETGDFDSDKISGIDSSSGSGFFELGIWSDIFKFLLFLLIFLLLVVVIYSIVRIFEVREKEGKHLKEKIEEYAKFKESKELKSENISKNEKWINVLNYINSNNENDWKLAIIECDLILDSLLNSLGFDGDSIGDKLKLADKDKYKILNQAWEAHKIRNRIAHEGSDFFISHNEAKRTVGKYEEVFRHYNYI